MAQDFFYVAQWMALALVGISALTLAVNSTLLVLVPQGIITDDATLAKLDAFVTISEEDLATLDSNSSAEITATAPLNPFAFINSAFDTARLTGGVLYSLFLGWEIFFDLATEPFGLELYGAVGKGLVAVIEGFGLLGFFMRIIAAFRGGAI